jgi:hypothetical protein
MAHQTANAQSDEMGDNADFRRDSVMSYQSMS